MGMRRLILRNGLSPGDIVMLTAAVRELHLAYPGQFQTDVRTSCPALWENNPYITPLAETSPGVEVIDCEYPLINDSNTAPYHCIHGFSAFLSNRLGLAIKPRLFKGDIHLSRLEKYWHSQVHEVAGEELPFWIIDAGGKYDVTIKWWDVSRYQAVVDHFRGRILFVQVGQAGHYHPRLNGVVDFRGQTNLRELVRLVYHAQGVLCPVTALMHLAAAVEAKNPALPNRPCVVIAGAREPAHWEAYPSQQFISTNGCVPCAGEGGCWKDRIHSLGDGDPRDRPEHLCQNTVNTLPLCMDLISPEQVIQRIEYYFRGRAISALTPAQVGAAKRAIAATSDWGFDSLPLTLGNARIELEKAVLRAKASRVPALRGRGIVTCGGGLRYFPSVWVLVRTLRAVGCTLPIELWHIGTEEITPDMQRLLESYGVSCRDASVCYSFPRGRRLGGWELKACALLHSSFREVLFLDADNLPVRNPAYLFDTPEYNEHGAMFWPDYGRLKKTKIIWRSCGLKQPEGPEFESGQILVDKHRAWPALYLALWFNENSDFYYRYLHGDKETFHLAFEKLRQPYFFIKTPIETLPGTTMCQHDPSGDRVFQHRNSDKWCLFGENQKAPGFQREEECFNYLRELRPHWDGNISQYVKPVRFQSPTLRIVASMITCKTRHRIASRTFHSLRASDWGQRPIHIEQDRSKAPDPRMRQTETSHRALKFLQTLSFDYALFLEDDLLFDPQLLTRLRSWSPLLRFRPALASLYNPGLCPLAGHPDLNASFVRPEAVFGSQAFLLSRRAVDEVLTRWDEVEGMQDIRISRLAGELDGVVWYHKPSLVQHVGRRSTWGGKFHESPDFCP
jgi:ADP-heptose:LPS heptosyltransferase